MENKKWLKITSVFIVGLLLFNLISFGGFAGIEVSASSDTNVALGKQYVASSEQDEWSTADMAFDENELTQWGSDLGNGEITESNPAWLMVDLGTPHTINRWVVVGAAYKDTAMESYNVKNIKLEGSNDGVNFTQIDFSDNNIEIDSSGYTTTIDKTFSSSVTYQYFRVKVTETFSSIPGEILTAMIYEFELWGYPVAGTVDAETPAIGTQPTGATVNQGATSPTLSVGASVGDGGTLSYQWYSNTTNSPSGGTLISGATNATYEAPTSTVGTVYYYVVVTNTKSGVSGNPTAPATSNVVGVTVNALVDAETPAIGTQPTGATVNQGATSPTLSVGASVGDGGTLSYQWYSNTTNSPSGGTLISGATNATYEAPTSTVGTVYYYVVVTNTKSGVSGNPTAPATSNVVGVTVNALVDAETPAIGTQPTGATVNQGATSPTLSVGASVGDGGTLSYQWYSNTTNSPSGGTLISGATNATYEAPTSTVGTVYYYVVVTNTKSGVSGNPTAPATSNVVGVTVNALVDAETPVIGTQPTGATVNQGATSPTLSVGASVGDGGTLSYQWYSNTTNSPSGGTLISGATNATYEAPTSTVGTVYYYVVVTNTKSGVSGNPTAPATSNVVGVTVNALVDAETPAIGTQPTGATVNQGATSPTLSVGASVGDGGTLSYQWYSNTTNSPSGGTLISGATNATYEAPTSTVGTVYYYVVVTNTKSGVSGNPTAPATSNVVGVTVNALVDAETPAIGTQPTGATVNQGATSPTLSVGASVGDGGTLSYQWYSNTTNSPSGGTAISGATNATYEAPTSTVGTVYYYVVVTNTKSGVSGNPTAPATSNVVGVTVNALVDAETPVIGTQPTGATVNQGAVSPTLSVGASVGDGGTLSYQWYSNTTNSPSGGTAISGATNATYEAPTSTVGTVYYYVVVTNTKSGVSGNPTAPATSNVVGVTVNALVDAETPVIGTQPTGATVNQGAVSPTLSVGASVGDGGTLSYQWYSNTTNSPSGGTAISGATNATYEAPTSTVGTVYYYVVVTNTKSGVSGNPTAPATSNVVGVTVNALVDAETPVIGTQPTGATVNQGAVSPTLSVGASVGDGGILSYQWYSNTTNSPSGGTAISGATNATYEAPTSTVGTVYYYVVVTNTKSGVSGSQTAISTSSVVPVIVNSAQTITITYNGNTNTGGIVPTDSETYEQGEYVTVLGNTGNLVKGGYMFAGWNTQADGSGIDYASGSTFPMGSGNVILYAKWNPVTVTYTVTFDVAGGSAVSNQTVAHGEKASQPTPAPAKAGYTFGGWYTSNAYTMPYNFDNAITANTMIYAKWISSNSNTGGGNTNSSSNPESGSTTPSANVEEIVVDVESGDGDLVSKTTINRTKNVDNTMKDEVTLTAASATETIRKLKEQGNDKARIIIPDQQDQVNQVQVSVPKNVVTLLQNGAVHLEIVTDNVRIEVPKTSLEMFHDDLYFRLVPIKGQDEQLEIKEQANKESIVQQLAGSAIVELLGRPMTIETNMQSRPVTLTLPLPTDITQEQLDHLAIYIEHSDGTKEVVRGTVVEFQKGIAGLQFEVNKFSTFSILYLPEKDEVKEPTTDAVTHLPYIQGYPDGTFRPEAPVTRAQMASMFARHITNNDIPEASATFTDTVKHDAKDAIEFVTETELFKGITATSFQPNGSITRAQMATVAARWIEQQCEDRPDADFCQPTSQSVEFKDVSDNHWARKAIDTVNTVGIMTGITADTFNPEGFLTRAQAVKILNRLFERQVLTEVQTPLFPDVPRQHWAFYEIQEAAK